ncbi:hypothetical protein [Leifsonia shinshuensis]|uniref:Uncharacterized protein n=1 Tax=Leifsonia shinshuensis TaxID=150026 RepID=A0A7G6YHC0_9MICO|nr:hypothetical protein [Leifsonia shinshuensis]QNE37885.1 hypothetical protein F1C12_21610 [Leifsonia shinshuensis]
MSAKTTKPKSASTLARERARAARAAQLEEQKKKEARIEDAATAYYLSLDKLDQLAAQREEAMREFDAQQSALELQQGKVIAELRSLETVATIADLLGISTAEVTRLSKLVDAAPAAGAPAGGQPASDVAGPSWPNVVTSQAPAEESFESEGDGEHVAA